MKNSSLFTCLYSKWTGILKPSSFDKSLPVITMIIVVLHLRLISVWKGIPTIAHNCKFSILSLMLVLCLISSQHLLRLVLKSKIPIFLGHLLNYLRNFSSFFSVFRMQKYRTMPNWYLMRSAIYSGKTLAHLDSKHKINNNYYCKKTVSYIFL